LLTDDKVNQYLKQQWEYYPIEKTRKVTTKGKDGKEVVEEKPYKDFEEYRDAMITQEAMVAASIYHTVPKTGGGTGSGNPKEEENPMLETSSVM